MLQLLAILHICISTAAASGCERAYKFEQIYNDTKCEELSSPAACEAASKEQYCWWMGNDCVGEWADTQVICEAGDKETCTSLMPPVTAGIMLAKTTSICGWTGETPLCQPELSNDMFREKCYPHTDKEACLKEGVTALSNGVCDWTGGDEDGSSDSEDDEVVTDIPCASDCAKEFEYCGKRWTIDYSVLENISDMDRQILYRCFHNRKRNQACESCSSKHLPSEEEIRAAQTREHNDERRRRRAQRKSKATALIIALSIATCLLMIILWAIRLEWNAQRETSKTSIIKFVDAHRYNTTSVDVEEINSDLPVVQRA